MKAAAQSPSALAIRPALERDLPLIGALARRIWPVCFAGILTPEQIANMLERIYAPDNLMREVKSGHRFWIAADHGEPVGYISAYKEKGAIWIKKLYLDASAQGKGIGARMVEAAVASFLPAREMRLLVHRENLPAQRFYDRLGFTRSGEAPVTMGDFAFVDYLYVKALTTDAHVPV
jgi:ribosomal protein S18 acetylase RimI-like enzyme